MDETSDHLDFDALKSALQEEIRAIRSAFPPTDRDSIGRRLAVRSLFSALDAYLPTYAMWLRLEPPQKGGPFQRKVERVLAGIGRKTGDSPEWDQFTRAVDVRNRLTHPKSTKDLEVSRADYALVCDAMDWIMKEVNSGLPEGRQAADPHGRQLIRVPLGHGQGDLTCSREPPHASRGNRH